MNHKEPEYRLKKIKPYPIEMKKLHDLMKLDFPKSELIPYILVSKNMKKNIIKAAYFTEGSNKQGYVLYQTDKKTGINHVMYFAIIEKYRSSGIGSVFLQTMIDASKNGIILEAEDPHYAKNSDDRKIMEKRIRFYEKNHLHVIDKAYNKAF